MMAGWFVVGRVVSRDVCGCCGSATVEGIGLAGGLGGGLGG